MSLDEYRRKRSFSKTPEPAGDAGASAGGWRFVIQKHHATNLHYDLRLELHGVLKSWAVPKGPSLNPADKRLAVHVEDHPLEYLHFEGIIPKGEYGGGTVMVWDTGTWEPLSENGYESGDLKFRLNGHKLQGQWMLVRTGKRKQNENEQRQWLLFKERDAAARGADTDVLREYPLSVLSGRSLEEIAADPQAVWTAADTKRTATSMTSEVAPRPKSNRAATASRKPGRKPHAKAQKRNMPKKIAPAIPTAGKRPPRGAQWLHEIKFDGYRMMAKAVDGKVRFISRNGKNWTDRLPRMAARLQPLARRTFILDGEVVFMAADGTTSFQSLQNTIGRGDDRALSYCLFDLLYLDGYDLTKVPVEDRRALLAEFMQAVDDPALIFSEHLEAEGSLVFEKAAQLGAEGIVSKRKGSAYFSGRTDAWIKTKCVRSDEFVIGGYTPSTADERALGALVVGRYEDGALHYEGRVGTGFSAAAQASLLAKLQEIEIEQSPFCDFTQRDLKTLRAVEPRLVAEIEYGGWTDQRRLRFPSYRGLREDRDADMIVRDTDAMADDPPPAISSATIEALEQIRLTHPDRVMYPDTGITKLGLATYYAEVADWILPYVVDRPLAVIRFPKGLGETSFFQKSLPKGMPECVRALDDGGNKKALVIHDVAGLLALVQFSALEIHVWGARADQPDKPDRIVLDLDPDTAVSFAKVREAAQMIREILDDLDLQSFVMTTGGKGLHVVVPIRRTATWSQVKQFAKAVASILARNSPGRFTTNVSKAARGGKIYLDYLRNGKGSTAIAPFSTRARPSASVATPIAWEEVDVLSSAASFSIANLRRRLESLVADPWEEFFEIRQSLTAARLRRVSN